MKKLLICAVLFVICMSAAVMPASAETAQVRWGTVSEDGTITWTGSGDFPAAVNAANNTDADFYIQLLSDHECTTQDILTNRDVTIDLNGKTLSGVLPEFYIREPVYQNSHPDFIRVVGNGTLTITDTSSEGGGKLTSVYKRSTIYANNLIVNGCTIENTSESNEWGKLAIYITGSGNISITGSKVTSINGSAIEGYSAGSAILKIADSTIETAHGCGIYQVPNIRVAGTVVVRGTSAAIMYDVPVSDKPLKVTASRTYDGSKPDFLYNPESLFSEYYQTWYKYVKFEPASMAARIGDNEFLVLQEAVDAVKDGQTIKMIGDIDLPDVLTIKKEDTRSFTIDLNNHKISGPSEKHAIEHHGSGTLTITDSSKAGGGIVTSVAKNTITLNGGSLVVTGGTVRQICNDGNGSISIIDNGAVKSEKGVAIRNNSTGKITISGSALVSTYSSYNYKNGKDFPSAAIYLAAGNAGELILEIKGGTIENVGQVLRFKTCPTGKSQSREAPP